MADKPTDEALENLFVEETGFDTDDFPAAIFGFARAVLAKWGQPVEREPLTDAMVSRAGRALSDVYATECGVDKEDNWKIYGSDFIETARLVLEAAHGIKHGGQHD